MTTKNVEKPSFRQAFNSALDGFAADIYDTFVPANTKTDREVRSAALIAAAVSLGPAADPVTVTARANKFVEYISTGKLPKP